MSGSIRCLVPRSRRRYPEHSLHSSQARAQPGIPLGQTLIVTSGLGWAQREGGPVEEIRPGDVVWLAPGEKHWHGASASAAMSHIAIQEKLNGSPVTWMEKVTDKDYKR